VTLAAVPVLALQTGTNYEWDLIKGRRRGSRSSSRSHARKGRQGAGGRWEVAEAAPGPADEQDEREVAVVSHASVHICGRWSGSRQRYDPSIVRVQRQRLNDTRVLPSTPRS
jgi:hypothetical protein